MRADLRQWTHRTGAQPAAGEHGDRGRATGRRRFHRGCPGPPRGRCARDMRGGGRRADARGGRRQPVDHRRGRHQGGQPVRVSRRTAPQLSRNPPRQDPPHRAGARRARAAHRLHQLPHARPHRQAPWAARQLRLRRAGLSLAAAVRSASASSPWCATSRSCGRRRRRKRWTSRSRRCARRAGARSWTGRGPQGEGSDYTDNVPHAALQPARTLVRGRQPPAQRRAARNCWRSTRRSARSLLHNIDTLGASIDPDALGAHLGSGAVLDLRGRAAAHRRPRRRPGARQRARAPAGGSCPAARGGRAEAALLQLDDHLDPH